MNCPLLKLPISDLRCQQKVREELKTWGCEEISRRANGHCPCELRVDRVTQVKAVESGKEPIKAEETMEEEKIKKGTKGVGHCPECDGDDKLLYACHGRDLCGKCKSAYYKDLAKLKAKRPVAEKSSFGRPNIESESASVAVAKAFSQGNSGDNKPGNGNGAPSITLIFPGDDKRIYDALMAACVKSRRTVDQEILWRLDGGQ